MSDEERPVATPSQTVGPFFHFGLASDEALGRLVTAATPGDRIRLRVRVLDGGGIPVPDALIEIYQPDARGSFVRTAAEMPESGFTGFGRLATNEQGACEFETVRPGRVITGHRVQAPHVLVCVLARGLLRHLYTRMYFAGDPGHDTDPVLLLAPADRRETLIASRASDREDTWEFVIRLQGEGETVFFDY